MIEKLLAQILNPILDAETTLRRRRVVIFVLALGAIGFFGLLAMAIFRDWWSWKVVFGWLGVLTLLAGICLARASRQPDMRYLAQKVEENHPDLRSALLAAMDQKPDENGELGYLQKQLFSEVSEHAVKNQWVRKVSARRLLVAAWTQFAAVIAFCLSIWLLLGVGPGNRPDIATKDLVKEEVPEAPKIVIEVSPGDVELEKGSRLVVEATFPEQAPPDAMLVMKNADGEKRVPMQVGLEDGDFSALLPKVDLAGEYFVRFDNTQSKSFSIQVFEFPKMEHANAVITSPAFLEKEPETITDTRKITVMEGSEVEWRLQVNKPLAFAELYGEDEVSIPLKPDSSDPTILVASHLPLKSQRYRVHLIDEADRSNKRPPWLTVNVKENLPPELKLTFPGKDFEISAVQELPIEATVQDDVKIEKAGFAYQFIGDEVSETLTETPLPGGKQHPLISSVEMEKLDAEPKQLLTYYFWAEDRNSEGEIRRTTSDMFFAEVRFFEEIIREGQPQSGEGGEGGDSGKLLELQKEVINAAWKLRRDFDIGKKIEEWISDIDVVAKSQLVVADKAGEVIEKAEDAKLKEIYTEALKLMGDAATQFAEVAEKRDGNLISPAHQTARSVFAKLIEARNRESEISMQKEPSKGQSQQQRQKNMNLELEQKELKYEENSKAQEEQQSEEQQENLAILSRLKELAKRQEAIAKKIKELEEQLQDANQQEKEEIERQLKRLQEEQRELLRETDNLSERMDSQENQTRLAEEREELDRARENIKETADKLEEGDLADAANSATRAQEELEDMEEDFRQRTSNRFAEEMRGIRDSARELAENQQQISEKLENLSESRSDDPFDSGEEQKARSELARELSDQSRNLSDVIEEMKRLSEEAEESEPILSDSLYEAVRNTMMNGTQESLEDARDYTFYNRPNQAIEPEQAASRGIEELKESIEQAAESVLGSEADALRLARSELDQLIEQTEAESKRLFESGEKTEDPATGEGEPNELAENGQGQEGQESKSGEGQPGEQASAGKAGEKGQPQPGKGKAGEKGQKAGEGKGEQNLADAGSGENPEEGSTPQAGPGQEEGKAGERGSGEKAGKGKGEKGEKGLAQGQQPGAPQPGQGKAGEKGKGQEGQAKAEGKGKGKGKGKGQESGSQPQPGAPQPGEGEGQQQMAGNSGNRRGALSTGGDGRGGQMPTGGQLSSQKLFFNQQSEKREEGAITGEDYEDFRDRLGRISEMLQQQDLRDDARRVADNARQMRIDFSRDNQAPQAGAIDQRITEPLVELRQRISEEIAKLNKENPLAPIDRDPVPSEFRDLVRRYYEQLGAGN